MTDQEADDLRGCYYAGMRAMSPEQMKARELEQAAGMRNAWPDHNYMAGMSQNFRMWPDDPAEEPPKPVPLTRWQRLMKWWRK